MNLRFLEIGRSLTRKNDALAAALRRRFAEDGTLAVNLLSSPGAGKTTLLVETLRRLQRRSRVAVLVGDQATDHDARRLAESGVPARQITTADECRLDAEMVTKALRDWDVGQLDALFIENVGNLICPAEYDLGEDLRVVLFSVTEGEEKPLKYPLAFHTAAVALITKTDLADAVGFDREAARRSLHAVNPDVTIIELSARTGSGVDEWIDLLETRLSERRCAGGRPPRQFFETVPVPATE